MKANGPELTEHRLLTVAIDPGGTTGMAAWDQVEEELVAAEGSPAEVLDWLAEEIRERRIGLVVCESFTITGGTIKKTRGGPNAAIETIGAIRYLCRVGGVPLVLQSPAEAKGFSTDDKLRRIGWFEGLPGHARDAARHLLLRCVTDGSIPGESVMPKSG